MRHAALHLASATLALLAACREHPAAGIGGSVLDEARVIARVGGEDVPRGLFEAYLRDNINLMDETPRGADTRDLPPDGISDEVRSRLLDRFLEEQALLIEARAAGMTASEASLDRFSQAMGLGPLALLHEGATITQREYLRKYLEDCYLVKSFIDQVILADVAATVDEARSRYDENRALFTVPDRFRLRLIRVDSLPEASAIRRDLVRDPSTFLATAQRLSEGTEGEQGKDLGLWREDELPDRIRSAVTGLAQGQVSEVVSEGDGFNIYLVEQRLPGGTIPFEQVQDRLVARLRRDKGAGILADYMHGLEARMEVELVEENLGFLYRERSAQSAVAATPPANGGPR